MTYHKVYATTPPGYHQERRKGMSTGARNPDTVSRGRGRVRERYVHASLYFLS